MRRTPLLAAGLIAIAGLAAYRSSDVGAPADEDPAPRDVREPLPPPSGHPNVSVPFGVVFGAAEPVEPDWFVANEDDARPEDVAFEIVVLDPETGRPIDDAIVSVGPGTGTWIRSIGTWTSFASEPRTAPWRDGAYRFRYRIPPPRELGRPGETVLIEIQRELGGQLALPQLSVRAKSPVTRVVAELGFVVHCPSLDGGPRPSFDVNLDPNEVREIEIRTDDVDGRAIPHASIEVRLDGDRIAELRRRTAANVHEPFARTDALGRGLFSPVPADAACEVEAWFGRRHGVVRVEPDDDVVTVVLRDD